ncbi:MAG: hypothetical protein R3B91_02055 [Planctomycetaceae bacterium]
MLIFAGATRMKTEVLSTSVFLEMNVGNIEGAVAVSLIMVTARSWFSSLPESGAYVMSRYN